MVWGMRADVVVIGGGPHGLAVLAALAARTEPWPGSVVVIDPHDGWATAWDEKLARLSLDRLRSPQVHHPGPRPMALRDLVEAMPEGDQLTLRRDEDERVPTPAGMRAMVDELASGLGPVDWVVGRADRLELGPAPELFSGAATDGPASGAGEPAGVRVHLASGRTIEAAHVVVAHNPSFPRIPEWAEALIGKGIAEHAAGVDLRDQGVGGRHVAIVGGGLTAGSLAAEVVRGGGRVTLLTRRPLRARPYDVDASWLGPRRLSEYLAAPMDERRALIDQARDGGTMPPPVLDDLRRLAAEPGSGLVIREAVDVETEIAQLLEERADEDDAPQHHVAPPVDAVWLATGFANDVHEDPLVAPLIEHVGIAVLGGLPEVTDELRLPGTPIFVAGPYAALGVGPASRNLAGARPAAARIAAALTG